MLVIANIKALKEELGLTYWQLRYLAETEKDFFLKKVYNGNAKSKIKKHTYWLDDLKYKEYLIARNKLNKELEEENEKN